MSSFKIGDEVDWRAPGYNCLYIKTLTHIFDDGKPLDDDGKPLETHVVKGYGRYRYLCYEDDIKKLNTYTVPIILLSTAFEFPDLNNITQAIYDEQNDSIIFLTRINQINQFSLYFYDITRNKYNKLSVPVNVPHGFLCNINVTFHTKQRLLYLMHQEEMIVLNIDNLQLTQYRIADLFDEKQQKEQEAECEEADDEYGFGEYNNKSADCGDFVHLRFNDAHYKFDVSTKKFVELNTNNTIDPFLPGQLLYVPSMDRLVDFNPIDDYDIQDGGGGIYYCDIKNADQECEWKRYESEIIEYESEPVSILAFKYYVFFFVGLADVDYDTNRVVYVMDLREDRIFRYEGRHLSYLYGEFKMVKDVHNDVHVIFDDGKEDNPHFVHYKFSLYDVIPNEMTIFYKKKNEPLVFGFVRRIENQHVLTSNFPRYLIDLINFFFPLFI